MSKQTLGKILMILLVALLLLFSLVIVFKFTKKKSEVATQKPENGVLPTPTITRSFSRWATDSAVLKIDEDLRNLNEDLKNVDLKELPLMPPILDLKITLEEKE